MVRIDSLKLGISTKGGRRERMIYGQGPHFRILQETELTKKCNNNRVTLLMSFKIEISVVVTKD